LNRFDKITCRLAIQVCTGRTPSGRARHRTFSIKNIRPDADLSAVAGLVRAIAKILAYPVTKASLVIKKIRAVTLDGVQRANSATTARRAAGFAPVRGFFAFTRAFSALALGFLMIGLLLASPFPASATGAGADAANSAQKADFEFRGTIDSNDPVARLLKKYVDEFSPEELFLKIDEQPDGGRFRDLYMDLTGVLIGGVRVDKLTFRMNDAQFNDPSEWPENVECQSVLQIYAYCRLKEEDINRRLLAETFGKDGHWKNISMKISPSGLYASGVYSANLLLFSLDILIEIESGLQIVDNRELWLSDYKVRVNTLGVPDYVTKKAIAQIQPLLNLGRFPLPLKLHRVEFGEHEAVLSTRRLPDPLQKGITYRYHREQ
jgi:hypothetical protein